MTTTKVKIQLTVFITLTAFAVGLIAFHYVKLPALWGYRQVHASAEFADGAGIYPQANVTYRGVTVGKVTAVDLAPDGANVSFRVDESARVPEAVTATIRSVSPIGEQYVDLKPRGDSDALMTDGSHIGKRFTAVPEQISDVLDDANTLVASVPLGDLQTALHEADRAFNGLGPELESLAVNGGQLTTTADENYAQTSQLLKDGEVVLDTQLATSKEIRAWTSDLADFSTSVRRSDRQFDAMLESLPGAAQQATATVDMLARELPPLLVSGQTVADLAADYHDPLEQVLVYYPRVMMTNIASTSVHKNAQRMAFKVMANYPGNCNTGWPKSYEDLGPRGPLALSDEASVPKAYCKVDQSDPRVARGARNLQCFEPGSVVERAASVYACRGEKDPRRPEVLTSGSPSPAATSDSPTSDPERFATESDPVAYLGGSSVRPTTKEKTWQSLLLSPVSK